MGSGFIKTIAALSAVGAMMSSHAALSTAIDFTKPGSDFTNNTWSLGFTFTANQNISVTRLGFYDDRKNGLTERHEVGLFDMSGSLLGSAFVDNGDALDGWFRYDAVAAINLTSGTDYVIAATTGLENYTWDPVGFFVNPAISFVEDRFSLSASLVFPTIASGVSGWFGPNFQWEVSNEGNIPEPGSLMLVGLALVGLSRVRRRTELQRAV